MIAKGCMGGWCACRDGCAYYHITTGDSHDVRLCKMGEEKPMPVMDYWRALASIGQRTENAA